MTVRPDPRPRAVTADWPQTEEMTSVSRTFTVEPSPDRVIDYLKDFSNAPEWDPGTEWCERIDHGPIAPGSRWKNSSKIAGVSTELVYELKELTDDRVVFEGTNDTATATDTITVRPHEGGSEITYDAHIQMHGIAKVADPVMKVVFEKIGTDTEDDLVTILNRLA